MVKQSVLIADRDVSFRQELRKMIVSLDYPAIFHETCNGLETVRFIDCLQPSVVFINASLPGLAGFDVLKKINHDPISVIISDNPEDAVRAIDHGASGYLHRPICTENLKRTLVRIGSSEVTRPISLGNGNGYPGSIFLEKGGRLKKVNVSEITYLQADRDYTWIYTADDNAYLSNHGIGVLSQKLDPDKFLRVHRSYMVNLEHVNELYKDIRRLYLLVTGEIEIGVGKQYVSRVRELIF
ncbi:LytR/AlgR family response regulator transcription factor [Sphingobacterium sp. UBA7249]|uniref:LytR/AlgR family response regulator transcription factor n=1 Tax=Sphingobacterium sp. UBA7249 TaxID=1947516 RepID=UPI0025F34C88|nr:LytTR family DNA-binding domain-containing protein [Sphingobacterium sp. UBA7249]